MQNDTYINCERDCKVSMKLRAYRIKDSNEPVINDNSNIHMNTQDTPLHQVRKEKAMSSLGSQIFKSKAFKQFHLIGKKAKKFNSSSEVSPRPNLTEKSRFHLKPNIEIVKPRLATTKKPHTYIRKPEITKAQHFAKPN